MNVGQGNSRLTPGHYRVVPDEDLAQQELVADAPGSGVVALYLPASPPQEGRHAGRPPEGPHTAINIGPVTARGVSPSRELAQLSLDLSRTQRERQWREIAHQEVESCRRLGGRAVCLTGCLTGLAIWIVALSIYYASAPSDLRNEGLLSSEDGSQDVIYSDPRINAGVIAGSVAAGICLLPGLWVALCACRRGTDAQRRALQEQEDALTRQLQAAQARQNAPTQGQGLGRDPLLIPSPTHRALE